MGRMIKSNTAPWYHYRRNRWDKVLKNGASKNCGRQFLNF